MDLAAEIARLDQLSESELGDLAAAIVERGAPLLEGEETPKNVAALARLAGFADRLTAFTSARTLGQLGEAVTASGGRRSGVAAVAAGRRSLARNPESPGVGKPAAPRVLLAAGSGRYHEDQPVRDKWELGEAMCSVLRSLDRRGPARGRVLVASALWDYPENRQVSDVDPYVNERIFDETIGERALTASGGICLPVDVSYDIPVFATQERPLRDGLPAYQASRGGLVYITPPDVPGLAAATGTWSEAVDFEPLAQTKPIISVSCGSTTTVYLAAIPTRLGFGNFQQVFQPELVAANTEVGMAAAARHAEEYLLEKINEACTKDITSGKVLGATPDIITAIESASAFLRYYHRLAPELVLTAVFPNWLRSVLKIDFARRMATSANSDWNSMAVSHEDIEDLLAARFIKPIWSLDPLPSATSGASETQQLALQSGSGAMNQYPKKCVWNLFPPNAIQFLDGGKLDLGVVRDSTLDSTNDWELFVETFEGIASRGPAHVCQQFVTELCANGKSSATETVTTCP